MARRKKSHEGHGNHERWLLTYADMITLLMAFFIMMYSMSIMNLAKFQEVALSIRSGFGGIVKKSQDGNRLLNNPAGRKTIKVHKGDYNSDSMFESLGELNNYVIMQNLEEKVSVSEDSRGIVITLAAENLVFARGTAELTPAAKPILNKVIPLLQSTPEQGILVEGHTCNLPINSSIYPSNWELSSARASSVVRYFEAKHIPGKRLTAVGFGSTRPRMPNNSEKQREMNRRVDIVILEGSLQGKGNNSTQKSGRSAKPGIKPVLRGVINMENAQGGAR